MSDHFIKPDHDEWSIAENPKEALLSFIDAGAGGDEPVKGVMQCHIREWFDEIEKLVALSIELNTRLVLAESVLSACDHTLTVHGHIDGNTELHSRIRGRLDERAGAERQFIKFSCPRLGVSGAGE